MKYVEAPEEYDGAGCSVFLAGSISDLVNWQSQLVKLLAGAQVTVFNPRRRNFPTGDRAEERRQIEWERRYLSRANLVAFWLAPPTACPIALFELGACCESGVPIIVGIDSNYALNFDVRFHLSLRRPDAEVLDNLCDVGRAIKGHAAIVENTR